MRLPVLNGPSRIFDDGPAATSGLDCVLIGPHIADIHDMLERAQPTMGISAHYDDVLVNSVLVNGRRLGHADLLNLALERATGNPHRLTPFRQPSSAICHLTSFLRRRGLAVEYVNFFTQEKERLRELLAMKPRAVALTTTFYIEAEPIAEVVRFVREHAPEARIVLGGPYIFRICSSYNDDVTQDYLLQDIGADFFIYDSQGESSLAALLFALRRGGGELLSRVPNLIWTRDNEHFQRTARAIERNDLDANVVDWSLLEPDFIKPTVYLRTAVSCPFSCSFCTYPITAGDHALTEIDNVMAQLRWLNEHGVQNVVFVDDTLNVPLPRFKTLLRRMIEERLDLKWMSFFRCSNADDETFELMGRAGCLMSFLGIESADESLLKNMDKFARLERYHNAIQRLHDNGILTHVSLIVGFPGETQRSVDATIEFVETTRPTFFAPQIFYHDTRTPLEAQAQQFGLRGTGFAWSHATADWRDAVRWTHQFFRDVKSSEVVGGYSLGAWGNFYLLTLGFSVEQLRSFMRLSRQMVLDGLEGREAGGLDELAAIFRPRAGAVQVNAS